MIFNEPMVRDVISAEVADVLAKSDKGVELGVVADSLVITGEYYVFYLTSLD